MELGPSISTFKTTAPSSHILRIVFRSEMTKIDRCWQTKCCRYLVSTKVFGFRWHFGDLWMFISWYDFEQRQVVLVLSYQTLSSRVDTPKLILCLWVIFFTFFCGIYSHWLLLEILKKKLDNNKMKSHLGLHLATKRAISPITVAV